MPRTIFVALWSRGVYKDETLKLNDATKHFYLQTALRKATDKRDGVRNRLTNGQFTGIFVGPEYIYSRVRDDWAEKKAMTEEAKDKVLARLMTMSTGLQRMLIIPGTVAYKKKIVRPPSKQLKKDGITVKTVGRDQKALLAVQSAQGNPVILNAGPAPLRGADDLDLYDREFDLQIGLARSITYNYAYALVGGQVVYKYGKKTGFHETFGSAYQVFPPGTKSGTAVIDGLTFGFEICFDHANGVLTEQLRPTGQTVDLHIICSAAVGNTSNSPVRTGGFILHASSDRAETVVRYIDPTGSIRENNGLTAQQRATLPSVRGAYFTGPPTDKGLKNDTVPGVLEFLGKDQVNGDELLFFLITLQP